jgi:DNA modification methylase
MTAPGDKKNRPVGSSKAADHEATTAKSYTLDPRNARRHPEQNMNAVAASLRELGAGRSIVVDRDGVVIGGNAVYEKARELGIAVREIATRGDELVVVRRVDLATNDPRRKALALADNQIATLAEWDELVLSELRAEVEEIEFETMGFASLTPEGTGDLPESVSLAERFLVPPFSVLNAREGWWQARKRAWLALGLQSELGRGNEGDGTQHGLTYASSCQPPLVYNAKNRYEAKIGRKVSWEAFYAAFPDAAVHPGTSVFDPVLCELAYRWFCPPGGTVLDPFAGGSVRGIVAAVLGRQYVGIDLSPGQIEANRQQAEAICSDVRPAWHVGDSRNIASLAEGIKADLVFSCPPYADLEVYSDDPADLSTLGYTDFRRDYSAIIAETCKLLKPDRFACFVVGEVRDKRGHYYGFVGDTVQAFRDAGLEYYNEAILVTQLGGLMLRVGRSFETSRKLGKTHQNVLVFVKGDAKKATNAIGPVEAGDPLAFAEEEGARSGGES